MSRIRNRATAALVALPLATAGVAWSGCGSDDVNDAADQVKQKGNEAQEKINDAGDTASNAAEDAKDKANNAVDDATGDDNPHPDDNGGKSGGGY